MTKTRKLTILVVVLLLVWPSIMLGKWIQLKLSNSAEIKTFKTTALVKQAVDYDYKETQGGSGFADVYWQIEKSGSFKGNLNDAFMDLKGRLTALGYQIEEEKYWYSCDDVVALLNTKTPKGNSTSVSLTNSRELHSADCSQRSINQAVFKEYSDKYGNNDAYIFAVMYVK